MNTANETQVGGGHYKTAYEHWDLVADFNLNYFEGQITKYVTRHHKKNKRQDLEKALHNARKLVELAKVDKGRSFKTGCTLDMVQALDRYAKANELTGEQHTLIMLCMVARSIQDMDTVAGKLEQYLEDTYPTPEGVSVHITGEQFPRIIDTAKVTPAPEHYADIQPGPGYTNQDR